MEGLNKIEFVFSDGAQWLLNLSLAVIMFAVALGIDLSHLQRLGKHKRSILIGLVSQWLLLPTLTILLVFLFKPHPGLAAGMVLVSSLPGGNVSNFFSSLSGGNPLLSVTLTAISTMLAPFVTPVVFSAGLWFVQSRIYTGTMFSLSFVEVFQTVVLILFLPVMLGIVVKIYFKPMAEKLNLPLRRVSVLILVAIIALTLFQNHHLLAPYLAFVFWIVLVHNSMALLAGFWFARIFLPVSESKTVSLETGIQNSGLGIVLILNFFDGNGAMLLVAAWWGVWHIVAGFVASWVYRNYFGDEGTPTLQRT